MKKRVAVVTEDRFLFQKIRLILKECEVCEERGVPSGFDVVFLDADSGYAVDGLKNTVTVGYGEYDLSRPFTPEALLAAVSDLSRPTPLLSLGDRCATLRGERVKLTEVEFALLSRLAHADGSFVSRDELIRDVWGDGTTDGILNVYVHYLREKLEGGGEKIIVSSRKFGYKIDEKYLRGGENQCSE